MQKMTEKKSKNDMSFSIQSVGGRSVELSIDANVDYIYSAFRSMTLDTETPAPVIQAMFAGILDAARHDREELQELFKIVIDNQPGEMAENQ